MEQVKVVSEYIKGKFSHFKQDKNNEKLFHFSENGENKSICIIEEKESELEDRTILFSKNFRLLVSEDELNTKADYFAFCFGELFYYVKREDIENPKLHILRYLGEYEISNEDFCHLGIHSTYSLLDGCQKLESYIEKAKYLNFKNLGICERQTLSSVFKFQKVCEKGNIKPIIGEELKIKKGEEFFWFKFYVKNKNGWKNLINLSNIVNVFGKENEKEYINEEDLFDYLDDLIIVLPNDYPFSNSNIAKYNKYEVYYQIDTVEFLDNDYYYNYLSNIKRYISNGYIKKIPPVLIGDSYYLDEEDKELRKVLHKIGNDSEYRFSTKSQHFKSIEEHIDIFSKFWNNKEDKFDEVMGAAISNTMKIADECNFKIEFEKLHIPTAKIDGVPYKHNLDFFEKLIRDRMDELGFTGIAKYEERVKEEYDVIVGADLENYFLIIWDILHWCKNNNILTGLARGSAAGSFIMFLLDIVKINPFDYDLLFSRFLNAGRVASIYIDFIFDDEELTNKYKHISRLAIPEGGDKIAAKYFEGDELGGGIIKGTNVHYEGHISLPDVDMDISDRERVKQFIINKYGEEQFALLGSYNTFKIKAAVKDLARVIGTNMEYSAINVMSSTIFFKEGVDAYFEEVFKAALNNSMFYSFVQENSKIVNCMYWMLDTPKSSSVHPCGVLSIPAEESIFDDFPLLLQKGEYMCEWTGSELDELGFVKNDLLGLAQLEFFENILKLIKDEKIDIYNLPLDDKKVFEYLGNGWNSEVFQFNSYLLINYCKLLKPTKVEDLSVAVAAVRPGPMNNGLHLKYVKRKNGEEAEEYKFGYEEFTKETFGIILFQEQVIRIASYLGDLTLVEGDGLRKALGKKKMSEMLKFHDKIKPHALEKGCSEKEFEDIWNEWVEFAKYAFNKSHSVSYALVGYISQWLKVHYPREFWTAAFQKANNSSNREEKFNQYFKELKESNSPIKVVKPEINTATNETTFEGDNIYFPLNNIKYLSNDGVEAILAHKKQYGDYYSFEEFLTRLGKDKLLNKREFENLILSGAFDKIEEIHKPVERKKLIIKLYSYFKKDYARDFLTEAFQEEELWWELKQLELVGVESINFKNLCGKYFERYRFFDTYSVFEEGQKVNFGGIILDYVERRSKKKGQFFGCITLGCKNIPYDLVMWPDDWEKYKDKVEKYKGQILLFEGEFKKNTMNNQMQLFILPDTTPIFLGSDGTKLEKPKPLTFVKGDFVKIDDNIIGKIVRNASNTQITIELEDGSTKAITKWDIKEVVTGYNDENEN